MPATVVGQNIPGHLLGKLLRSVATHLLDPLLLPVACREDTMSFSTYKLYLMHIESTFGEVRMPWNRKYDKVRCLVLRE